MEDNRISNPGQTLWAMRPEAMEGSQALRPTVSWETRGFAPNPRPEAAHWCQRPLGC